MTLIRSTRNGFPQFPSLFDDLFSRDLFNWGNTHFSATGTTIPAVNIRETKDNYEVEMAAPGMQKDDFKIMLEGNTLTITCTKETDQNDADDDSRPGYTRREFSYQSFERRFELPKDVVKADEIAARYENGLLLLTIPKQEHAKQKGPKMIQIA